MILNRSKFYVLALIPASINIVQLLMRFLNVDMDIAYSIDLLMMLLALFLIQNLLINNFIWLLTGLTTIHSIFSAIFWGVDPLIALHNILYFIVFPALLASSFATFPQEKFDKVSILSALLLALTNLLMFPVELSLRGGFAGIASVNFTGRSYEIYAALLLAGVLASMSKKIYLDMVNLLLVIFTLLSFSRGAYLSSFFLLFLLLVNKVFTKKLLTSKFTLSNLFTILSFASIASIAGAIANKFENISVFFLNRLNFNENGFSFELFFSSRGREFIIESGISAIREYSVLGIGLGNTKQFFIDLTQNNVAFSGFHNIFITALAERGLVIGGFMIILILFILFLLIKYRFSIPSIYYISFLIFATSTGAELYIQSSSSRNANISLYLFILYLRLTHKKFKTKNV